MRTKLDDLMAQFAKPAYHANLRPDGDDFRCSSKFGGTPYFESSEDWPHCAKCSEPLDFICQLDLRDCKEANLPAGAFGLITFFYCWECFPWETDAPGWSVRNYPEACNERYRPVAHPDAKPEQKGFIAKLFGARKHAPTGLCSVSFEKVLSVPDWDEFVTLVSDHEYAELERFYEQQDKDITDEYYEAQARVTKRPLDKYETQVGGYATWIQSAAELTCPHCEAELQLLFQVGSEDKADIMFGDAGQVYFMYCPSHPDVLKFELQCF